MVDDYDHEPEHSATGEEASAGADITPTPEGRGPSSTTGHLLINKHRGDGDFPGEQPHQHLFSHGCR